MQLKADLQKEMEHEPVKSSVKPQIKQPKVSPPKQKTDLTPPRSGSLSSNGDSSPSITEGETAIFITFSESNIKSE